MKKSNKQIISISISPEIIKWIDENSNETGLSRSIIIQSLLKKHINTVDPDYFLDKNVK